jgi:hypothetical protein
MIISKETIKTRVKCNRYRHSRDEKENVTLRNRPSNSVTENIMYIVIVIMEIMFIIQKDSQVFNAAGTDYRGLTKFLFVDQHFRFSTVGCNLSCATVEFHIVSSAPILYGINVKLQKIKISGNLIMVQYIFIFAAKFR